MLASSVQAVVVCNATALRVCTLVLFIMIIIACDFLMEEAEKYMLHIAMCYPIDGSVNILNHNCGF